MQISLHKKKKSQNPCQVFLSRSAPAKLNLLGAIHSSRCSELIFSPITAKSYKRSTLKVKIFNITKLILLSCFPAKTLIVIHQIKGLCTSTFLPLYPLHQRSEVTADHSSCSSLVEAPLIWLHQWNAKIRPQSCGWGGGRGRGLFTGPPLLHHITANPFKICIVIRFYWILYWYWAVVGLTFFPLLCHPVTFSLLQLLISEHSVPIVCSSQLLTSHCLCVSPHLLVYLLAWKPYHLPLTLFLSLHSFTWPSVGQDGTSRASVNPAEWQDCVHNPLTWLHSCKHTHNVFVECACTHSPWKKCHGGKGQLVFTQTSRRAVTLSAA